GLAGRGRAAVIAMLNRRPPATPATAPGRTRRSRGLLAIDVAAHAATPGVPPAESALALANDLVARDHYDPFSLAWLEPGGGWVMSQDLALAPVVTRLAPGWHVLTHADLDDRGEPRT